MLSADSHNAPPLPTTQRTHDTELTMAAQSNWLTSDLQHHLHPFSNARAMSDERDVRLIERADGVYIWDGDGRRILDGMSGLWCVNVGYGREELARAAYDQMRRLPYYNTFFKTTTAPAVRLADKLVELTPAGLNRVFFANSGSEANDTIVRMVRLYWELEGRPERQTIISRTHAYHGSTMASASLGGMSAMHQQGGLPLPGFDYIMPPYHFGLGRDEDPQAFGRRAADALEAKILELGPEHVAAFIGEPVQGAGGVIIPPASYWPRIQEICKKYDILLIADEVICGFGRTGRWFGSDSYDIRPDFMPMAKGLSSGYQPIAAIMIGDRVAGKIIDEAGEFTHGFTYSGHPVACAVAAKNLEIMEREHLVEHVAELAPYFNQGLGSLADHPLVGEVRSVGFLGAIELVKNKDPIEPFEAPVGRVGTLCRDHCFDVGLVMRGVRDSMVVAPPLICTREHIDELVDKARQALDLTFSDVKAARVPTGA